MEQQQRERFFSLISQHLGRLDEEVQHRLAELEAVGDLLPGELTVDDVVDSVVIRAAREFAKDPDEAHLGDRVREITRHDLASEVKRRKAWRRRTGLRTEQDIPETPPAEEVSSLGEEVLDFYEPDEDLKLEDVIADFHVRTPDDEAEARELRACVRGALAGLPRQWRHALRLRDVDGRETADVARTLGIPAAAVEPVLAHAREYLRQHLLESGCVLDR